MGRLKGLGPSVQRLAPRVGYAEGDAQAGERQRYQLNPWRSWYALARWKELRLSVLVRDQFTCRMCGRLEGDTSQLVADHCIPHRGNASLFWDETNIQCLCKPCHDGAKQLIDISSLSSYDPDPSRIANSQSRPAWFRKVHIPLTIVCGPPASGKSTYVEKHASPLHLVVCFDRLAANIFGVSGATRVHSDLTARQVGDVLRVRNELLADLMRASAKTRWPAAWLLVSEPKSEYRQWWWDTVKPSRIVVLETPPQVCKDRSARDSDRGDRRHSMVVHSIDKWWSEYQPRLGDTIIK